MIRWISACSTAKCTRGELVDALEAAHGLCHRMHGQPGGTRTPDLLLRRQLLYPVELRAVMEALPALPVQYGAARPIRTRNRRCDRTHCCHRRSRRRWWQHPGATRKRAGRHVRICLHRCAGHCTTPHGTGKVQTRRIGRSREIRTPDPLVPNQMRYQTALCSEKVGIVA